MYARGRGQVRFGACAFDPWRGELLRHGGATPLTPQALGLLTYLLDHRDREVSRDELLEQVWNGVTVSDGALSTAMYELRAALGDDGRQQRVIRTLRGRGFRFVAPVHEVEGAEAAPPSNVPPAAKGPPFVGRQKLLARLGEALAEAERGQPRVLLLQGEAGVGKTRLARHFAAGARARVRWGRCHEHAGAPPFWPWTQILRELVVAADPSELRRLFGAGAATLAGLAPEARAILPAPRRSTTTVAEARFQLFDGVAALLRTTGRQMPLLLVIDDVHCADLPSLRLLEFLAAALASARVLLVATYRSEDVTEGQAFAGALAELTRSPQVERHVLHGLEPAEVRELLATVAGRELARASADRIAQRSEGNPLFVLELAHQLAECADAGEFESGLPQPIQEIIRRRIARLAPGTQEALGVAAVLGRTFRLDVLARTWDLSTPMPATWLNEATRAHVVTVTRGDRRVARFAHALFQEVFYARLDFGRRCALHRRAGESLEAMHVAPADAELAVLAHHFDEALPGGVDPAKAVAYSIAAARAASQLLAYEEAVEHYGRARHALEWSGTPDPTAYAELLLELGTAQDQAGDAPAARTTLAAAAEVARRSGSAVLLAHAALGYAAARDQLMRIDGNASEASNRQRAGTLLSDALAALPAADRALRARVAATLAVVGTALDAAERERLSRDALASAEQLDDPALLTEVVAARREMLWAPDNVEQRLKMATTIVVLAQRAGDREHELCGRAWRLTDLLELGEVGQVRQEMDACDRLAEDIRQPKYRYHVAVLRASLTLLDGRFPEAERLATAALADGRRMRCANAEVVWLTQMTAIRREQGRMEEMADLAQYASGLSNLPAYRFGFAWLLSEMDHLDAARAQFELLSQADFADVPRDRNFLTTMVLLADVCTRLGDRPRAGILYALLVPFETRNVVASEGMLSTGAVAMHLIGLAATLERWADAERHFRTAMAVNTRAGAVAYVGQVQRAYAEMLLARNRPGDLARGLDVLDQARETAERYGSRGLLRRVLAIRARALAPPLDTTAADPITPESIP